MTPKEKAKDLVDKYSTYVVMWTGGIEVETQNVKQCALIAVDEMLSDYLYMQNVRNANSNQIHSQRVYWQEVKQEIENL